MYFLVHWFGGVAQLARAPALQAGGQEFDSPQLHQVRLLIKYNYPPVKREGAVEQVIRQAELKYQEI